MRICTLTIMIVLSALFQAALACSPLRPWRPPTPESAFLNAEVVVHARVISQKRSNDSGVEGQIKVIQVLKGSFSGDTVWTADSSICGIDNFNVGQEYVFFFPEKGTWFVSHLDQPWDVTAQRTLDVLRAFRK